MKREILICLMLLVMPVSAWAGPVEKGNFVVTLPMLSYSQQGGDLYEDLDGEDLTSFGLSLGIYESGIQYFITSNFAIGGILGFTEMEQGIISSEIISVGPMASFYFPMEKIIPYAGIGYLYESANTEYEGNYYNIDVDTKTTSFLFKGGIAAPVSQYLALYGEFSVTIDDQEWDTEGSQYFEPDSSEDGTTFNFALGVKAFF